MMTAFGLATAALSFLCAMSIVIVLHELGHLMAARALGISADRFSVGFGPAKVLRTDSRGTSWVVSAIPLGGYVRFPMAGNRHGKPLMSSPVPAKIAVVLAGPAANFLLSILLFAAVAMINGRPSENVVIGNVHQAPPGWETGIEPGDTVLAINGREVSSWADVMTSPETDAERSEWRVLRGGEETVVAAPSPLASRVWAVSPGMPADRAGVMKGDVILSLDGEDVRSTSHIKRLISTKRGEEVSLRVWRPGTGEMSLIMSPTVRAVRGPEGMRDTTLIGVSTETGFISPQMSPVGPVAAARLGVERTWHVVESSFRGIAGMLGGTIGVCNLGGAVSMAENSAAAATSGPVSFALWIAVLSAALGFFNLLPIPALDGGHAASFLYESVRGKAPSEKALSMMAFVGTATIILLMMLGVATDITC